MTQHSRNNRIGAVEVAAQIRQLITSDSFHAMSRLPPERQLCATYGVSRGTIRNALLSLQQAGLVEIRPSSGTYVIYDNQPSGHSVISNASPLELIDARFALEPHICRLAVLHGQKADFDRLQAHLDHIATNIYDPREFSVADSKFHLDLAKSTGNNLLIWTISQINDVRKHEQWSKMRRITLDTNIINTYNTQHQLILTALRERDPEHAAMLMKDHLDTARRSLTFAAQA